MVIQDYRRPTIALCVGAIAAVHVEARAQTISAIAAELGVTPEAVLVAGLQDSAQTILSRIEAANDARQSLAIHRQYVDEAAASVSQWAMAVQANPDDTTASEEYVTASTELDVRTAELEQSEQTLRTFALDGLEPVSVQQLENWRTGAEHRVPAEFRVAVRTSLQWQAIELALRAESRALGRGEILDQIQADLLTSVRTEGDVLLAGQRLVNLDEIKAIFESFEHP